MSKPKSYPIISDGTHCPCCGHRVASDRILVDLNTNTVTARRRRATLRPSEAEMLSVIAAGHPGTAPIHRIRTALWGGYDQPAYADRIIHIHATRIRSALKQMGLTLESIPGRGYRISGMNHDPA